MSSSTLKLSVLCDRCRLMTSTEENIRALRSSSVGIRYEHYDRAGHCEQAGKGCELCAWVISWLPKSGYEGRPTVWWMTPKEPSYFPPPSSSVEDGFNGLAATCFAADGSYPGYFGLFAFADFGDPALPFTNPAPHLDPASDTVIEATLRMIQDCQNGTPGKGTRDPGHRNCPKRIISKLPTRVIDIKEEPIRLYVPEKDMLAEYVALSYCWGRSQAFVTTNATLKSMEIGFSIKDLPPTLRDAVVFTQKLGFRYLWIDALCIIQDNEEDKDAEIASMGAIYKNSVLTISAANAETVSHGFLHVKERLPECLRLPLLLPDGTLGTFSIIKKVTKYDDYRRQPLDSRGWALQEALLSPRLLAFEREVIWTCPGMVHFSNSIMQPRTLLPSYTFYGDHKLIYGNIFHAKKGSMNEREIDNGWQKIAVEYSRRKLTNPNDKFVGLAGVAQELQGICPDQYYAGHWGRSFIRSLAWSLAPANRKEIPLGKSPSWSWLCCESEVSFGGANFDVDLAKFVSCKVFSGTTQNPFGRITGGELVLMASLVDVRSDFGPCAKHWSLDGLCKSWHSALPSQAQDNATLEILSREVMMEPAMPVVDNFLLLGWVAHKKGEGTARGLLLKGLDDDTYQRVGEMTLMFRNDSTITLSMLLAAPKRLVTLV